MIDTSIMSYMIRIIMESLIFIWSIHFLTGTKIVRSRYLLAVLIDVSVAYIMKYLPIQFGLNALLFIIELIVISTAINKVKPIKAIQAVIGVFIIISSSEIANMLIVNVMMGIDTDNLNPLMLNITRLPSLIFFIMIVILVNKIINTIKRKFALKMELKEKLNIG